jgi:hypothetical protein
VEINERIKDYIHNPFPLWDGDIADLLIDYKWNTSLNNIFQNYDDYSISGCILKDVKKKEKTLPLIETNGKIQIAFPSNYLSDFYDEHGLVETNLSVSFNEKIKKVNRALNILGKVKPLQSFIFQLVKSIQIIESEDADTDISYSHPDIPFSIFFSLCEDNSIISDLRVAESILHESMHLMLTLIENQYDLIVSGSQETFYSPWRDEQRSIRGVLHAAFVFRAIKDFYFLLVNSFHASSAEYNFLKFRIIEIEDEFLHLKNFPKSYGLTELGEILSFKLLSN